MSWAGAEPTRSGIVLKAPPNADDPPKPNGPPPNPTPPLEKVLLSSPSESVEKEVKNQINICC